MRIYETQRIQLNNDFLIYKGRFLERYDSRETEVEKSRELKQYCDFLREQFQGPDGEKLENVISHYTDEQDNYLIIFPVLSKKDNKFKGYYDCERELHYIEITECN